MTHRSSRQQRGAILAATLVCLLVVMLFAAAVARSMVLRQRSTRSDDRQLQCFWIVESAALRAIAKVQLDPSYRGEVWRVSTDARGLVTHGIAEIHVEPVPEMANHRQIKVSARWPDSPVDRVVKTKQFIFQANTTGAAP